MPAKVLAVHGYGFIDKYNLGIQSETVCRRVARIQSQFDEIILLGGWHDKDQNPDLTSGKLMKEWLLDTSVIDSKKLHTIKDIIPWHQPPRDTAEEVEALKMIHNSGKYPFLGESLTANSIYAVGLWYHVPRIKLLYGLLLGAFKIRMIPAFSWQTTHPNQWSRIVQEPIGLLVNWLDPEGRGNFMKNLRKRRTHSGSTA